MIDIDTDDDEPPKKSKKGEKKLETLTVTPNGYDLKVIH